MCSKLNGDHIIFKKFSNIIHSSWFTGFFLQFWPPYVWTVYLEGVGTLLEVLKHGPEYYQKDPRLHPPARFPSVVWKVSKRQPNITFSQFPREICTSEKNFKRPKIFGIEFSTKMVSMKIHVAIILTKLQRFEYRSNNVRKSTRSLPQVQTSKWEKKSSRIRENFVHGLGVKFNANFEYDVILTIRTSGVRFGWKISGPAA